MKDGQIAPHEHLSRNVKPLLQKIRSRCPFHILTTVGEKCDELLWLVVDTSAYMGNSGDASRIDDLARLVGSCLSILYQTQVDRSLESFRVFLDDFESSQKPPTEPIAGKVKHGKYPLLEIYVRVPTLGGPGADPSHDMIRPYSYGYVTEPGTYECTITRPWLFKDYLYRQLTELIKNHQPVIRVRLSSQRMPIHFAFDADAEGEICPRVGIDPKRITRPITAQLPIHFAVPLLGEIDDVAGNREVEPVDCASLEYINENYFRQHAKAEATSEPPDAVSEMAELLDRERAAREAARDGWPRRHTVRPLSLFTGPRVDYSLGRIKHYTKTPAKHFQNFVVFTNYPMYMDEFFRYAASLLFLTTVKSIEWIGSQGKLGGRAHALVEDALESASSELQQQIMDAAGCVLTLPGDKIAGPVEIDVHKMAKCIRLRDSREDSGTPADNEPCIDELVNCVRAAVKNIAFTPVPRENRGPSPVQQPKDPVAEANAQRLDKLLKAVYRECGIDLIKDGLLAPKTSQMPAYHWERPGAAGITIVNMGVGPSNAKTITDHLAVLRPHVFLTLGHCGGLRATQRLGHYVLANGYVRGDAVLDPWLKKELVIPTMDEIDQQIVTAFGEIRGCLDSSDDDAGWLPLRTGTVITVADRNWEMRYPDEELWPLEAGKCVAVDMESATIAANGFRYSVPYATFLCVSDKPLHGELKMEGMAEDFYRSAVTEHCRIALRALEALCASEQFRVHGIKTRQLRAPFQPPFQ